MRVLVFEYITGGGLSESALPASLAREGELMFAALTHDLAQIEGVELIVMRDGRLPIRDQPNLAESFIVSAQDELEAIWHRCLDRCDAVWPIAPETRGIMEHYCREVALAGKMLLNSPAHAVRLTASKLDTLTRLATANLPSVPSLPLEQWHADSPAPHYYVIKPDDGAGCEGSRIVDLAENWQPPLDSGRWLVQPLLSGNPLSLCVLFNCGSAQLLSINRQLVERHAGGFKLQGCQVNALQDTDGSWQKLAEHIAAAIPELWGYAGVDLILEPDGPQILEINPRLTTSYAGLHQATGDNPAAHVLSLWRTGKLPAARNAPGKMAEILLETELEY